MQSRGNDSFQVYKLPNNDRWAGGDSYFAQEISKKMMCLSSMMLKNREELWARSKNRFRPLGKLGN